MAQPTWTAENQAVARPRNGRLKFVIAGVFIIGAVALLITQAIRGNQQFYITVNEYYATPDKYAGRDLRMAGWVIGDSIEFTQIDAYTSRLEFDIVDDLSNPTKVMRVVALNEPLPDLLQHEAQAVVEGQIDADGAIVAHPNGLLLKCPTRYEELDAPA